MPCLAIVLAAFFPRVALAAIWLLTDWFGRAYNTVLWPVLGFIFMPYTTLAYMAAMLRNHHTVDGGWLVLLIVAVFIDLGGQGHLSRKRNWRRR